jgi:hypothetical protein
MPRVIFLFLAFNTCALPSASAVDIELGRVYVAAGACSRRYLWLWSAALRLSNAMPCAVGTPRRLPDPRLRPL